jgi:hypothetical protein
MDKFAEEQRAKWELNVSKMNEQKERELKVKEAERE